MYVIRKDVTGALNVPGETVLKIFITIPEKNAVDNWQKKKQDYF